ncbi:MAG: 2-(3-amino-3-carboxypropyl)histidine synthase subunit 1/2 [Thermoprotei archaeon]
MAQAQSRLERDYDFEIPRVLEWVRSNGFSSVMLQSAPGLVQYMPEIAKVISKATGSRVAVDSRGRFGACDVYTSLPPGVNAVVHFGHTGFVNTDYPIIYVPAFSRIEISPLYATILEELRSVEKVGLEASVQHVNALGQLKARLEEDGKTVILKQPGKRGSYPGQVVGCDYYAAIRADEEADAHLVVSGGFFHSVGLALSVSKPVLHVDPYTGKVNWIQEAQKKRIHSFRGFAALRLMRARKVAVLDSSIPGQRTPEVAERVAKLIRDKNQCEDVSVFLTDLVSDQLLMHLKEMGYEVAVTASCTRLATDDYDRSPIPLFEAREVVRLYSSGLNVESGVVMLQ